MAVGTIIRFSEGMNADLYDAVIEKAGFGDKTPAGLIFHAAGEVEGRFQIFDVWGAPEDRERFDENRLWQTRFAVMEGEQVIDLPDAEVVHFAVHNFIIP